jgi:hypothetical protein
VFDMHANQEGGFDEDVILDENDEFESTGFDVADEYWDQNSIDYLYYNAKLNAGASTSPVASATQSLIAEALGRPVNYDRQKIVNDKVQK